MKDSTTVSQSFMAIITQISLFSDLVRLLIICFLFKKQLSRLAIHSPASSEQMCKGWDNYLAALEETFNTGKYILNNYQNMSHKFLSGCDILELTELGGEDQAAVCCQRESQGL